MDSEKDKKQLEFFERCLKATETSKDSKAEFDLSTAKSRLSEWRRSLLEAATPEKAKDKSDRSPGSEASAANDVKLDAVQPAEASCSANEAATATGSELEASTPPTAEQPLAMEGNEDDDQVIDALQQEMQAETHEAGVAVDDNNDHTTADDKFTEADSDNQGQGQFLPGQSLEAANDDDDADAEPRRKEQRVEEQAGMDKNTRLSSPTSPPPAPPPPPTSATVVASHDAVPGVRPPLGPRGPRPLSFRLQGKAGGNFGKGGCPGLERFRVLVQSQSAAWQGYSKGYKSKGKGPW